MRFPTPGTMKKEPSVKPLFFDSYVQTIQNSVNSNIFKTVWAEVGGKRKNITQDGRLSCAIFVSSVLILFNLIKGKHTTVAGTLKDMESFGWKKIKKPRVGCVLVWEDMKFRSDVHSHIGFYMGGHRAISNSRNKKTPQTHNWTYGHIGKRPKRKIVAIYWHSKLNNKYF